MIIGWNNDLYAFFWSNLSDVLSLMKSITNNISSESFQKNVFYSLWTSIMMIENHSWYKHKTKHFYEEINLFKSFIRTHLFLGIDVSLIQSTDVTILDNICTKSWGLYYVVLFISRDYKKYHFTVYAVCTICTCKLYTSLVCIQINTSTSYYCFLTSFATHSCEFPIPSFPSCSWPHQHWTIVLQHKRINQKLLQLNDTTVALTI